MCAELDDGAAETVVQQSFLALAERCEGWKELAKCLDDLCVCYRLGKPPAGKLLNRIRHLKDRLGFDGGSVAVPPGRG